MPNDLSMKTVPAAKPHSPLDPKSKVAAKARFFNSIDAFNIVLNPVPDKVFINESVEALASNSLTGYTACDSALDSENDAPATTPFLLARYARINKGEKLDATFNTIASIWYVIKGKGKIIIADQEVEWKAGDVFLLPGVEASLYSDKNTDSVLWLVTNEPQMKFENTRPLDLETGNIDIVHYPSEEIERQIKRVNSLEKTPEAAGIAVIFSSENQLYNRNITPTLTLAMNTLPPGEFQRAHRHNSVAVSLIIQGENCYSVINGSKKNWTQWGTTVTPPLSLHSHHNKGDKQARFLIVQDGGIYYHARTMGFSFG